MKHSKFGKMLALVLTLCLCLSLATPALAAGGRGNSAAGGRSGYSWSLGSLWERLFGGKKDEEAPAQPGDPEETEEAGPALTLVEDETTVEGGASLRASTYAATLADETYTSQTMTYKELYDSYKSTTYYYLSRSTYYPITSVTTSTSWNGSTTYSVYSTDYYNGYYPLLSNKSASEKVTVYTLGSGTTTSTIKYFPVTLYNYTAATINAATYAADGSTGAGIYFNDGNPQSASVGAGSEWNYWNKGSSANNNANGQYTYSGLVNSTLDANKNISFTKPDGGIFNSDASVKKIYTNVEMPFVYADGTYTFDASQNGAYFYANDSQGSTAAQSNGRLYFNQGNPQSNGGSYGDGSTTVWMPFNNTQSINGEGSCDYHFGMSATIPFTMTANGKMNPNDDNSEDITFSFSGDDDVWVFIDGVLVLDIGGIHNRLDATINFAENTWSLSKSNNVDVAVADYNGAAISGALFNENGQTGVLNQSRETFAAKDSHELTIFYLERGAGSSNCKIQFNLPMKDTVSVTKQITQSKTTNEDGTVTTSPLTPSEQATIDAMDFGFTLYKDDAPVANASYNLLNANGQVISIPSTDANGHFTLRNGQTAKFVGEIDDETGNSFYVVEDSKEGFYAPDYIYTAAAAKGAEQTAEASSWTSMTVKATGSDEAEDSVAFTCENYMDNKLTNPGVLTGEDKVVIDYGLPVVIDVLKNDVYRGEKIELNDVVTGAQYGTATVENGKITYQLTKPLSGVEVLTYHVTVTNQEKTATGTGTVYIIPATSMYYEENFSDLVTFTGNWENVGAAQTDPQEPGVVGTVGDSPYGSDAAYLNDSGDSNGSSKHVDTTQSAASFSYTFTGTGTSFFARTSGAAAYMRVVITNESNNVVYSGYRSNIYKSVEGTNVGILYNVPVFTQEGLDYGTYTVTVSIAKANATLNHGADFYLDGIRVINPLNESDANASVARAAYATDGEANMTVATLRQKLLADAIIGEDGTMTWDDNFVVFTDSNGEIKSAGEYQSNGPKEEVYLNNGQSVTFSLAGWDANTNKIYLGVKAPLGSGSVSINGHTLNLSNAADCYYDISSYATINTGEDGTKIATFEIEATNSLISVTNIKVTGNDVFPIVPGEDVDANGSGEETGDEAQAQAAGLPETQDPAEAALPADAESAGEGEAPAETETTAEEG